MTTVTNTAEGGTNGATPVGGTGTDGSGTKFFSVQVDPGGSTLTYQNATVKHGSLAYRFTTPATAASVYAGLQLPAAQPAGFASTYCYINAFGGVTGPGLFRLQSGASATCCSMAFNSTGNPQLFNAVGSPITTLSGLTIPTSKWFRAEFGVLVASATVGQLLARFYLTDPEAYSPDFEYLSAATLNTQTSVQSCRFGQSSSGANEDFVLDTLQISDSWFPGPFAAPDTMAVGQLAILG